MSYYSHFVATMFDSDMNTMDSEPFFDFAQAVKWARKHSNEIWPFAEIDRYKHIWDSTPIITDYYEYRNNELEFIKTENWQ